MSHPTMRAKMLVQKVTRTEQAEELIMHPVAKSDGYPADGYDEDNSFSKWSPSGELKLLVTNENLWGQINPGETFYVDFTKVQAPEQTDEFESKGSL